MKKLLSIIVFLVVLLVYPLWAQQVTPNGLFTYSVPIELPPATNGMGQELSINYASTEYKGLVGVGLSLS